MSSLPPPRLRLGNYELLVELASGGMATVHIARQIGAAGFERLVVVKRVHPHLLGNREFYDMFRDEARVASLIRHPNVVSVIDVVEEGGELFLVMEYVESVAFWTLTRMARENGVHVPPGVVSRVLCDTLSGLEAAHQATDLAGHALEVVHRDVSPQNVIVGIDGTARLIDFGVAKAAHRLSETRSGGVKGKIAYMSPEQATGLPVDRKVDIFAAGVMLHEALTGKRLFHGENDLETMRSIFEKPIPNPSEMAESLPRSVDIVVQRALARTLSERYGSAAEFQDALELAIPPASARDVARFTMDVAGERIVERRERVKALLAGEKPRASTSVRPEPMGSGSLGSTVAPAIERERKRRAAEAAAAQTLSVRRSRRTTVAFVAVGLSLALVVSAALVRGLTAGPSTIDADRGKPTASTSSESTLGAPPVEDPIPRTTSTPVDLPHRLDADVPDVAAVPDASATSRVPAVPTPAGTASKTRPPGTSKPSSGLRDNPYGKH